MTHNSEILIVSTKEKWLKLHLIDKYSISEISRLSGYSRDTLHRWKRNYLNHGLSGLIEKSKAHRYHPHKTNELIEQRIIQLRKRYRFCALKIQLRLQKENIAIHPRTVHKILKRNNLIKKKRQYARKDVYHKKLTTCPGELVEIDVKFAFKLNNQWTYQFTAIDDYSRWRYLKIYQEQSTRKAMEFVCDLINHAPFKIKAIKTDNGAIFTNRYFGYYRSNREFPRIHAFDRICAEYEITHYLIDKGKPAQNGKVERSHRTDDEEFYQRHRFKDLNELIQKQKMYLNWYNNEREHLSLKGLTPNQMIINYQECQI